MIILTGGAGFIGSATLAALNARGYNDILVVDNLRSSEKWKNLVGKKFTDYLPREALLDLLEHDTFPESVEAIIHLGACSSTTEKDVDFLIENNYRYSVSLAEYSLAKGIRFIYASSAATYGDGSQGYSDEAELQNLRPLNAYGFSKYLFDLWLSDRGFLNDVVGIKFFNVYGPNESHKGSMRSMVKQAHEQINSDGKVRLFQSNSSDFKDGEQKRDFIYVKDCAEVITWFLENPSANGLFNLGSGVARTWNDLANAAFKALNRTPQIEYVEMPENLRKQYQNYTCASMEKLRSAGYQAKFTSLEDGIADYLGNYLEKDVLI